MNSMTGRLPHGTAQHKPRQLKMNVSGRWLPARCFLEEVFDGKWCRIHPKGNGVGGCFFPSLAVVIQWNLMHVTYQLWLWVILFWTDKRGNREFIAILRKETETGDDYSHNHISLSIALCYPCTGVAWVGEIIFSDFVTVHCKAIRARSWKVCKG